MKNIFGEETIPPKEYYTKEQIENWYKRFVAWANKEYTEKSDNTGRFCCGYEWCCEECEQIKMNGCEDCVDTIIEQLELKHIPIDYLDYDFAKWEEKAKND